MLTIACVCCLMTLYVGLPSHLSLPVLLLNFACCEVVVCTRAPAFRAPATHEPATRRRTRTRRAPPDAHAPPAAAPGGARTRAQTGRRPMRS